jgi:hypothetical protein
MQGDDPIKDVPTLRESSLGWANYHISNRVKSYGGYFSENFEANIKKATGSVLLDPFCLINLR